MYAIRSYYVLYQKFEAVVADHAVLDFILAALFKLQRQQRVGKRLPAEADHVDYAALHTLSYNFV